MDDRSEIAQLLYRVYAHLDEHDFDGIGECFTEDAIGVTPGGRAEGPEALIAQARRNHQSIPRVLHRVSNVIVDVEGDVARIRAVVEGAFADDSGTLTSGIGEVYRAEAFRGPDGWRLSGFVMTPIWRTGA